MKIIALFTLISLGAAAPKQAQLSFRHLYKKPIVESQPNPRIIGGHEATPHSLPYQALIEVSDLRGVRWYCGGTLITRNYVLTSAHCLQDAMTSRTFLGTHNYNEQESTQVILTSNYFTRHPNYKSSDILYDLGLIRLPQSVRLTDSIDTIVVASNPDNNFAGSLATVSGWGITDSENGQISDVLNYLTAAVIKNSDCESYFGKLDPTLLCIAPEPKAGICAGDAGGPLVTEGVLIGVAAFTAEECIGYPAGFTRIASFIDWLKGATDL